MPGGKGGSHYVPPTNLTGTKTIMQKKLVLIAICFFALAAVASAQNRVKLFDPTPIGASDWNVLASYSPWGAYKSVQVYLSCPTGETPVSSLTGPNGGPFIIDNALVLNTRNVCGGNCFSLMSDPMGSLGGPVEAAYTGVGPLNVSQDISRTGLYTFTVYDIGYTFGTSAVYLNTSCSIIPINTPEEPTTTPPPPPVPGDTVLCHRNNGSRGQVTLTVGPSAVNAHLAHGDSLGACTQ